MAQAALINPTGASVQRTMSPSLLTLNGNEAVNATHAAAVVTFDLDVSRPTILSQLMWGFSATPGAGAVISVQDGLSNTIWQMPVPAAPAQSFTFNPPLAGTKGNSMIITLTDGGAGIVGYVFANAYREQ
jgi:hypothetical protein